MAEAKDEAGGRALEFGLNGVQCRLTFEALPYGTPQGLAKPEYIYAALLANPEARMAVLEKMPEYANLRESSAALMVDFDRNCDQLEQALAKLKTMSDARLPHLEEAAELLRKAVRAGYKWPEYVAWYDRDQALSAPTAESGKDSACYCNQYQSSDIPCPPGKCPNVPPAPVAEAPERVTHRQAMDAMSTLSTRPESESLPARRVVRSYITQQEQSEREVASLRAILQQCSDAALRSVEDAERLQSQLTAAERKAEGLRVANAELKLLSEDALSNSQSLKRQTYDLSTKLAESERKLAESSEVLGAVCVAATLKPEEELVDPPEHAAVDAIVSILEERDSYWRLLTQNGIRHPASSEPAGVEAVWTQEELDAVEREATELHEKLGNPTPTETEAPARLPTLMGNVPEWIRIGKPVRLKTSGQAPCIIDNYDTLHEWVSFKGGTGARFSWDDIEPYEMPTEAPARFRVGQRVRWRHSSGYHPIVTITSLPSGSRTDADVRHDDESHAIADIRDLEPADPAPPKPGVEVLTVERMVAALRACDPSCCGSLSSVADRIEHQGGNGD